MFLTPPSVSQSVRQSVSQSVRGSCFSSETAQHNFVKFCSYKGAHIQGNFELLPF